MGEKTRYNPRKTEKHVIILFFRANAKEKFLSVRNRYLVPKNIFSHLFRVLGTFGRTCDRVISASDCLICVPFWVKSLSDACSRWETCRDAGVCKTTRVFWFVKVHSRRHGKTERHSKKSRFDWWLPLRPKKRRDPPSTFLAKPHYIIKVAFLDTSHEAPLVFYYCSQRFCIRNYSVRERQMSWISKKYLSMIDNIDLCFVL